MLRIALAFVLIGLGLPGCGKGYSVPDSVAGRATKCRACGTAVTIPMASEPAQAAFAAGPSIGSEPSPARSGGKLKKLGLILTGRRNL